MSAVGITNQPYTGPGSQQHYAAQYAWVAVREAIDEAKDLLRQALGNASEGWEGHGRGCRHRPHLLCEVAVDEHGRADLEAGVEGVRHGSSLARWTSRC